MAVSRTSAVTAPSRDPFYDSPEWREFAARIRERDGHRCTVGWILGGECSGILHVNHIVPRRDAPHRQFDPDNCGTACASHHPRWEALRRTLIEKRLRKVPRCRHRHAYPGAREECERKLRRQAGLLVA